MFRDYDDIITLTEMMEILVIGRNKAYDLLRAGQIKSFKIGKAYRIPKNCIEEYILLKVK